MRKNIFAITLCILSLQLAMPVLAVTPTTSPTSKTTPTPTPKTPSPTSKVASKVEDLKERLATKVAELRQSAPRAIHGTVTQVSVSTLTVDAQNKAIKIELTDDIKVIQMIRGKRTSLSSDDIDKDDKVTVFGDYDSTIDILKAKTIFIESKTNPVRIHGFISAVNKSKNSITLKGLDDQEYTLDYETTTKAQEWKKETGFEKIGFSKLEAGQFVSVLGLQDTANESTYTAVRLLVLQAKQQPTPTVEITPTKEATNSAATPTPTKKAAVTPTKKVTPTPEG